MRPSVLDVESNLLLESDTNAQFVLISITVKHARRK